MNAPSPESLTPRELRVVSTFMHAVEANETPKLDDCFPGFDGDPKPALAASLAEYESRCRLQGEDWSGRYAELLELNPRWQTALSEVAPEPPSSGVLDDGDKLFTFPSINTVYTTPERLGRGGCGETFLVFDQRNRKDVVVKIPRGDVPHAAITLELESQALAKVPPHPNIVRQNYSERNSDGELAIFFDFVKSSPVSKIKERPSELRVLQWMIPLCDAVETAHKVGVYHADIKPENVLICEADDRPLLIDFGLSQTVLQWSREPDPPAIAHGTPQYFAPELCDPAVEASPQAVDVFGLGATMFFLMTGEAPFPALTGQAAREKAESYTIDWTVLEKAPYSQGLKAICRLAIARAPTERYAKPGALAHALANSAVWRRQALRARQRRVLNWRTGAVSATLLLTFIAMFFAGRASAPQSKSEAIVVEAAQQAPTKWQKVAAEIEVDPASITKDDFRLTYRIDPRFLYTDAFSTDSPGVKGGRVIVTPSSRLIDLADSLQYRWGKRRWEPMLSGAAVGFTTPHQRYAIIDRRALELDNSFSLRLGGDTPLSGDILAGPFAYEISATEAFNQAEIDQKRRLMKEAAEADPFASARDGFLPRTSWSSITYAYVRRYEEVISEFRFGTSPDELKYVVANEVTDEERQHTSYSFTRTKNNLNKIFSEECKPLQSAPTLWMQLKFTDGSVSEVKRLDLRKYGRGKKLAD